MLSALSTYNPLQILFCIGVNNLLDIDHKIEDIKRDFTALTEEVSKGEKICVSFMELPFIPKVSKFPKDRHMIPIKMNRTADIADLNRFLKSFRGKISHSHTFYPSLVREGITSESFETIPVSNRHDPDGWVEKPLEKSIHLTNHIKAIIWGTVLTFFQDKCKWDF